jgi:glutathione S-transferase
MKLYDLDHSPFAARVRIAIRAKGLAVECVPPPGGARSTEYSALTPTGLVPALELEGGSVIPECEVIVEYLEDRFADPSLRPGSPEDRARARLLARLADVYLSDALKALFEEAKAAKPDAAAVARSLPPVRDALALIDHYLPGAGYAVGGRLSTADCALAPLLFFVMRSAGLFENGAPFAGLPRLAAYWEALPGDPNVAAVFDEMEAAQVRRAREREQGIVHSA